MSEPYGEYEFAKNFAHIAITGQSSDPKKVLQEIQNEIQKINKNGIQEEQFNRVKNMIYGNYIKEYNDVSNICRMFISSV